jgi:uncharacterized membrane protein
VLVGGALVGCAIAVYLALYQFGVLTRVWEPFFGSGSQAVLHSGIARSLPFPDALLGAVGYGIEVVTGLIGGANRWRAMPWIVLVYGLTIVGLGLASLLLLIFQPVLLHAWCTLCLLSAAISLSIVGPALDEVVASLQFLRRERRQGGSLWHALWGGGHQNERTLSD